MDLIGTVLALHHARGMFDRLAVGSVSSALVTPQESRIENRSEPCHTVTTHNRPFLAVQEMVNLEGRKTLKWTIRTFHQT